MEAEEDQRERRLDEVLGEFLAAEAQERAPSPADGRAVEVFLSPAGAELGQRPERSIAAAHRRGPA